ncbi:DNA-binding protein [Amycolatopsis thailandensis]|uniref:DNA-binding protein n=1 Tax=Amycolatopsis thailandensis TaxID=589330 RepID=A0A229SFH8_9PSEU|nr:DNA-binding protein [Amycolatopsis thailandensis]
MGRRFGQQAGDGESAGHESGRRIVTLLRKKKADLTVDDEKHMRKVVGYVHRHLAQRPAGDIRNTRWRYSLMNWGHDPGK